MFTNSLVIYNYVVGEIDTRNEEELETLVWTPGHHLTDRQIDQFLVISRYFVRHYIYFVDFHFSLLNLNFLNFQLYCILT